MNDKPQKIELNNLTELSKVKESNYIKDKLIKLNNSTYKINYQQSNQLHCNVKAPRKHVTLSNDNQSDPHSILETTTISKNKFQSLLKVFILSFVILAKTNPEEEEIQVLRDFINDSFEDVIVDKLPDIPDQINNSRRGNIILNIIIKKDQDVEPKNKFIIQQTNIKDMLKRWFSKFDTIMSYFQVLINPEHAKYTAFITHIGKFEYTRIPQGLVNSPSTFVRLMVEIFGKIKILLQYFDDLLVHSKLNYMVHFI
ncbi:hypothetical protein ACTFIY_008891 [Dictyostelium cf. discoideum]